MEEVARLRVTRPLTDSIESLSVVSHAGSIHVVPLEGKEASIEVVVSADPGRVDFAQASRKLEDHVRVGEEKGRLVIEDAHGGQPDAGSWTVSITVGLPRPLPLEARTGAGSIEVKTARGEVSLKTGAGNIDLDAPKDPELGAITATTGAGNVGVRAMSVK